MVIVLGESGLNKACVLLIGSEYLHMDITHVPSVNRGVEIFNCVTLGTQKYQ